MTPAQRRRTEHTTGLSIVTLDQISAETIRYIDKAEESRRKSTKLKENISGEIKHALYVVRTAFQHMALSRMTQKNGKNV